MRKNRISAAAAVRLPASNRRNWILSFALLIRIRNSDQSNSAIFIIRRKTLHGFGPREKLTNFVRMAQMTARNLVVRNFCGAHPLRCVVQRVAGEGDLSTVGRNLDHSPAALSAEVQQRGTNKRQSWWRSVSQRCLCILHISSHCFNSVTWTIACAQASLFFATPGETFGKRNRCIPAGHSDHLSR